MLITRFFCLAALTGAAVLSTAASASEEGTGAGWASSVPLVAQPSAVSLEVAPIVGSWSMIYDWDCDGSVGTATWFVNADGTFRHHANGRVQGTWTQVDKKVKFTYNKGGTIYEGKVKADTTIRGTMLLVSGHTGCFSAERQ